MTKLRWCSILILAVVIAFGAGASDRAVAQSDANPPRAASAATPQPATTEMLRRVRVMLVHYWSASFDALFWRNEFKPLEAWQTAATAGDFRDYLAACDAIAAQRKADPAHFDRRFTELRAEVESGYLDRVAAHLREVAGQ